MGKRRTLSSKSSKQPTITERNKEFQKHKKNHIDLLSSIASGKDYMFTDKSDIDRAKLWLKYIEKYPTNAVERGIQQHFDNLCQYESTPDRNAIIFWIEWLEGKFKEIPFFGESPIPDELFIAEYTRFQSASVSFTSMNFAYNIKSICRSKFFEAITRADKTDDYGIRISNKAKGSDNQVLSTIIAVFAGVGACGPFVRIYHRPTITETETLSFLRTKYNHWISYPLK
jgi:hypothetical protein